VCPFSTKLLFFFSSPFLCSLIEFRDHFIGGFVVLYKRHFRAAFTQPILPGGRAVFEFSLLSVLSPFFPLSRAHSFTLEFFFEFKVFLDEPFLRDPFPLAAAFPLSLSF